MGGDLSRVRESLANSRRRSEPSLPLDDCGHRGDLPVGQRRLGRRVSSIRDQNVALDAGGMGCHPSTLLGYSFSLIANDN